MPSIWTIWSQLSTASHQKGKDFEKLVKWFLLNDPKWNKKFSNKKVFLWNESPHAWGNDNGVDLTAEDVDGAIWAIQAKAWHPNKKLTKSEIDSFLAESSRELIDYRLIVTTAKGMSKQLEQAIKAQEKKVEVILGKDLASSRAPWVNAPISIDGKRPDFKINKVNKKPGLGCFVIILFFVFTLFLLSQCATEEDVSNKPQIETTKPTPQKNQMDVSETREPTLLIPSGYSSLGSFYYKWVQEIPIDNYDQKGIYDGVFSIISVVGLCRSELDDGVINSVVVFTEARNSGSSVITGYGESVWSESNTYEVKVRYSNIGKAQGKQYKEVTLKSIACRA
jgi:hypothetical protein